MHLCQELNDKIVILAIKLDNGNWNVISFEIRNIKKRPNASVLSHNWIVYKFRHFVKNSQKVEDDSCYQWELIRK